MGRGSSGVRSTRSGGRSDEIDATGVSELTLTGVGRGGSSRFHIGVTSACAARPSPRDEARQL